MQASMPDLATLVSSLLPMLERGHDRSNLVQVEAIELLHRAARLFERGRELTLEQVAIGAELREITERLERLEAGASAAPVGKQ
jgi:hypothetical protein